MRVVFERGENHDCLLAILWRRGRPFLFSIGEAGNRGCSFEDVRESGPDVLPTKIVRTGVLSSHKVHEVIVLVRSKCLRAFLDGAPIVGCQVDDEGLSLRSEFVPPRAGQLALATWDSAYEFLSCDVRPVTGRGTLLRGPAGP